MSTLPAAVQDVPAGTCTLMIGRCQIGAMNGDLV